MSGKGEMKWPDGSKYYGIRILIYDLGGFADGVREGYGEMHNLDGSITKGFWKQGVENESRDTKEQSKIDNLSIKK
jgi:hypothetical protein